MLSQKEPLVMAPKNYVMWWKVTTPSGIMMVHAFDLTKVKDEFEVLDYVPHTWGTYKEVVNSK
jgi:hypothetical protein